MKKILSLMLVLVLALGVFAGCAEKPPVEGELDKINIAYHTNVNGAAISVVGVNAGIFEKYGLDANLVGFTSGPVEIAAMGAEEIDFGYIGHGAHTMAIKGDVDILTFEKMGDDEGIYVSAESGVTTLEGLKGMKIGTQLGTSGESVLRAALESVGLDPEEDVEIVNMDMGTAVVAMITGQIDSVCVFSQYKNTIEDEMGDKVLKIATTSDFPSIVAPASWIATPEFIEENEELTIRFLAAILESIEYYKANMEEGVQWCSDFLEVDYDTLMSSAAGVTIYSNEEYLEEIADGSIEDIYTKQQENFLASGSIDAAVPVSDYYRFDLIEKAYELMKTME